jgi:hypothetical protein
MFLIGQYDIVIADIDDFTHPVEHLVDIRRGDAMIPQLGEASIPQGMAQLLDKLLPLLRSALGEITNIQAADLTALYLGSGLLGDRSQRSNGRPRVDELAPGQEGRSKR